MKLTLSFSIIIIIIIIGFILSSCHNSNSKNAKIERTDTIISKIATNDTLTTKDEQIPIFYNMLLSGEMSNLFKSVGAIYNNNLLNSPEKVDKYNTSTDKAMNLGVYAVDLSYSKYFEQFEQASRYLKDMNKLATGMGIPEDQFFLSVKRIETNLSNKDSLVKIANELYFTTDKYLKDNERESSAALIIMGGWIEALYIATNLDKNEANDFELVSRIADQKFSLVNLLNMLNKYQNEKIVKEYIKKLIDLQVSFAKFNIDNKNMAKSYNQLKEITDKLRLIRTEIVS